LENGRGSSDPKSGKEKDAPAIIWTVGSAGEESATIRLPSLKVKVKKAKVNKNWKRVKGRTFDARGQGKEDNR